MKTTPWFSPNVKPTRAGFYDTRVVYIHYIPARNHVGGISRRRVDFVGVRLYWNGSVWRASPTSPAYTAELLRQDREWRGVFSHAKT